MSFRNAGIEQSAVCPLFLLPACGSVTGSGVTAGSLFIRLWFSSFWVITYNRIGESLFHLLSSELYTSGDVFAAFLSPKQHFDVWVFLKHFQVTRKEGKTQVISVLKSENKEQK